jgi:hypothetical protein
MARALRMCMHRPLSQVDASDSCVQCVQLPDMPPAAPIVCTQLRALCNMIAGPCCAGAAGAACVLSAALRGADTYL